MNKKATAFALIVLSFITLSASATSPIISAMGTAFPTVDISLITLLSTLPNLTAIPCTLISGRLAGRKVRFRSLAIFGISLLLVAGVCPSFATNFYLLLIWRALFGCGIGIMNPLVMPVMMAAFTGSDVNAQASRNMMSTSIGAVVFQMAGGMFCTHFGWRATFLIYLLFIPVLICTIKALPEPPKAPVEVKAEKAGIRLYKPIIKWCVVNIFYLVLFYVSVTEMANVIASEGYGSPTLTGTMLSIVTGLGVVGGWIYKKLSIKTGNISLAFGFFIMAAGYAIMALAGSAVMLGVCCVVLGTGFGITMPGMQVALGLEVPQFARSTAASIMSVCGSVGSFSSKFVFTALMRGLGTEPGKNSFYVCIVGLFILGIVTLVLVNVSSKKKAAQA